MILTTLPSIRANRPHYYISHCTLISFVSVYIITYRTSIRLKDFTIVFLIVLKYFLLVSIITSFVSVFQVNLKMGVSDDKMYSLCETAVHKIYRICRITGEVFNLADYL